VSEERGEVSVAMNGRLTTSLDDVRLRRVLRNALGR
jgi:DNA integrity scanning protein DisA with diadenylate cyclase activity